MSSLKWMRAQRCCSTGEFVQLLVTGALPPKRYESPKTRQNELVLCIKRPHLYFFLGRTTESFGPFAYAIAKESLSAAVVTPCDTGGLVDHIPPVKDWSDPEKVEYLNSITWPHSELELLLNSYPGSDPEHISAYLDPSSKPAHAGPHCLWGNVRPADIWKLHDEWRAWTWEARSDSQVLTGQHVIAWTCAPGETQEMLKHFEKKGVGDDGEIESWASHLLDCFVPGGIGSLIEHFANEARIQ